MVGIGGGPMEREIGEKPGELAGSTVTANLKAVRYSHVGLRSCWMCARREHRQL